MGAGYPAMGVNFARRKSIYVPGWVCEYPQRRTVMSNITTVGIDLAKNVFQVHGADAHHMLKPFQIVN